MGKELSEEKVILTDWETKQTKVLTFMSYENEDWIKTLERAGYDSENIVDDSLNHILVCRNYKTSEYIFDFWGYNLMFFRFYCKNDFEATECLVCLIKILFNDMKKLLLKSAEINMREGELYYRKEC